jgi:PPIC-type PPIASE domain.
MKRIVLLLFSVLLITAVDAKKKKDPVVMTVVGKDVLLSEFLHMAEKSPLDFNDKKAVDNYVELFKIYKLKVADAEASGMHEFSIFKNELERHKMQLQESFLSDKKGEQAVMRAIYERTKIVPKFKQMLFAFSKPQNLPADTLAVYNEALKAYNRIKNGESFESVHESIVESNNTVFLGRDFSLQPFMIVKTLEDKVYSMEPGELSMPIRSSSGYHILKLESVIPNPGRVKIAVILFGYPSGEPTDEDVEKVRFKADSVYQLAMSGEDFSELAKVYSTDTLSGRSGGLMPEFGMGELGYGEVREAVERVTFSLQNKGDVSKPLQTPLGFYLIKLVDKKANASYEEMESSIYGNMKDGERNFELYAEFDQKMKERHGYKLYPEAYAELESIANEYFPTDTNYIKKAILLEKPLVRLDDNDFPQAFFVEYMYNNNFSTKTFSHDNIKENFDLFIRRIVTEMERQVLERDYPEFNNLVREYYDGMLLFELRRERIDKFPAEEQDELEAEWEKELNEKYPVKINDKVIKKISKHIKKLN